MQNLKTESKELASVMWSIADKMRGVVRLQENAVMIPFIAFVAMLMKDEKESVTLEDALDGASLPSVVKEFLLHSFDENLIRIARIVSQKSSKETLREFVLYYDFSVGAGKWSGECGTPDCISKLALAILKIEPGERVADFGCGYGNFLVSAADVELSNAYYGIEINAAAACLAQIRMELIGADVDIEIADMLSSRFNQKFDKVFSNYPFGMRLQKVNGADAYYEEFAKGKTGFGRPASADWIFNKLICESLTPAGEAVAIMTNGASFNGGDKLARKYFLDKGMIRAVVALPDNLFRNTAIATTLIVFGRNEGSVRFVDASDLVVPGRRWDTIGNDEIELIVERLSEDGPSSRLVTKDEITAADYSLSPSRFLGRKIDMVNPTAISELANSIERGAGLLAKDLDAISTQEDTGISFLRISDICDGRLTSGLPNIKVLDDKLEKQCLKNGDLIISKNGSPFKVAVAEVPEGQTILANGNLYIVRLNTERVDPYYVAAFLSSEDGKEVLSRMAVGTVIPSLPIKNLKLVEIPLPLMEQQREVANEFLSHLDEIEVLKIRLEKARNAAAFSYDEVMNR